jgi:hypothetical protein
MRFFDVSSNFHISARRGTDPHADVFEPQPLRSEEQCRKSLLMRPQNFASPVQPTPWLPYSRSYPFSRRRGRLHAELGEQTLIPHVTRRPFEAGGRKLGAGLICPRGGLGNGRIVLPVHTGVVLVVSAQGSSSHTPAEAFRRSRTGSSGGSYSPDVGGHPCPRLRTAATVQIRSWSLPPLYLLPSSKGKIR